MARRGDILFPAMGGKSGAHQALESMLAMLEGAPEEESPEAKAAERSFHEFVRQAWPTIEPGTPFRDGWYVGCMCEHLQAVSDCQIKRLVINTPFRHGKSLLACVMWFAWSWLQQPHLRFIYTSYSAHLSERDQKASRNLILSPWYQNRWGSRFHFKPDQNTSGDFRNSHGGFRIATSMSGFGLGEGGHIVFADDPVNTTDAVSRAYLNEAIRAWTQTFSTRFTGTYDQFRQIVMMQRIAENDLSGYLIAEQLGYETLILPAEYEPKRYFIPPALRSLIPAPEASEQARQPVQESPGPRMAAHGNQAPDNAAATYSNGHSEAPPALDPAEQEEPDRPPRDAIIPTTLQLRRPELMDPRKEPGDILWPERFTREGVEQLKAAVKHGWAGQGQQRPSPEEGDIFKRPNFRYCDEEWIEVLNHSGILVPERAYLIEPLENTLSAVTGEAEPDIVLHRDCRLFQTTDTAISSKQRSDETVVLTWALAPVRAGGPDPGTGVGGSLGKIVRRYLLLLDIWHARIEIPHQYDALKTQRLRWPGLLFQAVENRSSGSGHLQQAVIDGIPMTPLEPGRLDKVARASTAAMLYGHHSICHRRGMPGLNWLEDQLLNFPAGAHDDGVDCVAYAAILYQTDRLLNAGMDRSLLLDPTPETAVARREVAGGESYRIGDTEVYFPDESDFRTFLGDR